MLLKVNADKLQTQRERAQMTPYRLAKDGTTKMTNYLRAREIAKVLCCKIDDIFIDARRE